MYSEDYDGANAQERSGEDVFSKPVRAGKRTYFFDVKATKGHDYYLTITESKLKVDANGHFSYDKHKMFLYKEDFAHFTEGLNDVISLVQSQLGNIEERQEWTPETDTTEATAEKTAEEKHEDKSILGSILNRLKS